MPDAHTQVTCKKCGLVLDWNKLRKHHITVHGMKMKPRAGKDLTPLPDKPLSVMEQYQKARNDMKQVMSGIDDERQSLHNRLRELDDLAAKLKPLL